jgi:hypothetical protein
MTSTISPEHVFTSEHVYSPEPVVREHIVPEQLVPDQPQSSTIPLPETTLKPTCINNLVSIATFMDTDSEDDKVDPQSFTMVIETTLDQPSSSNTQSTNFTNSQPSSSNLAIVPTVPPKPTKIP